MILKRNNGQKWALNIHLHSLNMRTHRPTALIHMLEYFFNKVADL